MIQTVRQVAALLSLLLFTLAVSAQQPPQPGQSNQSPQVLIPAPPQINAGSYILMDATSGAIIMEHNSRERLPPASLTKMMTAYIVERELAENRIAMTDKVPISVNAWKTGGSRTFVREGTQVSVEDLLKGVIVQSGNDASVALAEFIAGSEGAFADIMNQQAKLLGMNDTHFATATGLPTGEDQYSSAYDLAILARAIIRDYPENYKLYSLRQFTFNDIRQPNRNRLLWRDPSVDGLKTGHTEEAGFCLVASAMRDGTRMIGVVMNTSSFDAREQEVQKMLNFGFRYYETVELFAADRSLMETQVWGGEVEKVALGVPEAVTVTIPQGARDSLESVVDVDSVIKAPVEAGQELGRIKVSLDGKLIVDQPILALDSVSEGGFLKRIWDSIKLFFVQLFS